MKKKLTKQYLCVAVRREIRVPEDLGEHVGEREEARHEAQHVILGTVLVYAPIRTHIMHI